MEETNPKNRTVLITLLAVVLSATITGGAVYAVQNKQNTDTKTDLQAQVDGLKAKVAALPTATPISSTITTPTPIATATPSATATPDLTADWKTFSSKLFGWSIKYPATYYINSKNTESNFTTRGEEKTSIGGDTYWAAYDLVNYTTPGDIPKGTKTDTAGLMVYKETEAMTLQQFQAKMSPAVSSSKEVKAGDLVGIQYTTRGTESGTTTFDTGITTVFKKGPNFYQIHYGSLSAMDATFLANYKTAISTFKFTN